MLRTKLDQWCESIIEAGWLAALVVAPIFFNVFSSRVFEPDKISLVRSIALVMVLAWLIKIANGGALWLPAYQDPATNTAEGEGKDRPFRWQTVWRQPFFLPVLLLLLAYLLSTSFSVARFVSWFGSYQRLQGTYSFLSYVLIAMLTAAHLRRPDQLRRLQHAIILTSLPISIYGVIQHYDIDPLPWGGDVTIRIAANAGNAIFLAAYLIMAFFFTLERVYNSFALLLNDHSREVESKQDLPIALAGGAYLFILMVQALAIFWTQSRGPWLGLFLGFYLFILLILSSLRPRNFRRLTAGWVGFGLIGVLILLLMNTTALFSFLEPVPYIGRLTQLLNQESRTAQVRLLIWEGASHMVEPHEPLIYPDGETDSVNLIRPLVGYGPEAMWVAYNPFYPPDLAHWEQRNASPDRSHNETWDSLVITGILGFVAYMSLFLLIFFWSLRWLGLLINRRDKLLFFGLLGGLSLISMSYFLLTESEPWRFFGVAIPAGIMAGLFFYVTIAAFLHPDFRPDPQDVPRQMLMIALLATIAAHFVEIHFGIAIAATRTYFWIETATLLTLGLGLARPAPFSATHSLITLDEEEEEQLEEEQPATNQEGKKKQPRKGRGNSPRRGAQTFSGGLPATFTTDLLIFFTFVFIYMTNSTQVRTTGGVLFNSITKRVEGGELINSPAILFLMLFTWLLSATIGLAAEALRQRRAPDLAWWVRNFLMHAGIVWGGWLIYGLIQAGRLVPGAGGPSLDEQLSHVAGHFALYTWIIVFWIVGTGTIYAWPHLQERAMSFAKRPAIALATAVIAAIFFFSIISTVNVELVRADIIYKQGQQFDNRREWVSSIELYRRALATRKTEDHYMLFLGRALLEQAKSAGNEETYQFPDPANVDDVLSLTSSQVQQMSRTALLRAAAAVLLEAQRINPLNTDHTANLSRLYRTWADLSTDATVKQTMLDKSIGQYNMAVQLSPNAAHLWNEKGNAHLARGEEEQAEAAYRHSLGLDQLFEQTYLLLADFYDRRQRYQEVVDLLEDGIVAMDESSRFRPTAQMYSFLGVAYARLNDLPKAIEANQEVLAIQPTNVVAMRNLALLYRDNNELDQALAVLDQAFALLGPEQVNDIRQMRQLAAQIYQGQGNTAKMIEQYEIIRQLIPDDLETLRTLGTLYNTIQDDRKIVEIAQLLLTAEPDNYQHPLTIAQALQRVGQIDNARSFAEQALIRAPAEQKPVIEDFIATLGSGQ